MMPSLFARALGGFLFLALVVPAARADQPEAGTVVGVAGQCLIDRGGQQLALTLNSAIDVGDVIDIPADGKVKLRMNDGSILSLAPQTNLTVTTYTVNPQGQRQGVVLTLGSGLLRAVVALGQQPSSFEVQTATGSAGVRATDWFIEANSAGTGVAVLRGSVDLKTTAASGGEVLINAGQSSSITAGTNPTPPAAMSTADFNSLIGKVQIVTPRPAPIPTRPPPALPATIRPAPLPLPPRSPVTRRPAPAPEPRLPVTIRPTPTPKPPYPPVTTRPTPTPKPKTGPEPRPKTGTEPRPKTGTEPRPPEQR
jgi:hypothetical protein